MRPKNSVSRHLYFCLLCHFSVDVQCSEEALWIDRLINSESLQTLKDELQEALPRAETTETGTVFVQRILWKLRIVTVSKQKPFVKENCQCFASVKGLSTCSGCHQVSRGEAKKPERWSARREALWQYYGSTMAVLWQIYPWQSAVFLPNVFDRSHNCVGTVCRLFPDLDAQDQPDERTG